MQVTTIYFLLWLSVLVTLGPAVPDEAPQHLISGNYGFSVTRPQNWYLYEREQGPAFFNFPPGKSTQGELPDGGASIVMITSTQAELHGMQALAQFGEKESHAQRGINIHQWALPFSQPGNFSSMVGLSFDQPAVAQGAPDIHFILVLWEAGGRLFGAELSCIKNDRGLKKYEGALVAVVRSFRLN